MHQYGSSILLLTNPNTELHKMEMTFRNGKLGKNGQIVPIGEPLMNESGISSVIGVVQSIVSQVTVLSNLEMSEIKVQMEFLAETLAKDLMINRKAYDIVSATARDKIYFTALSTAFITMKRAYEEGDKRFWKGSVQEITTKSEAQKSSGGLMSLFPWNRR